MPPLSEASQVAPDLQLHSEQPDSTNLMLPLASTGALAFKRIEPNTLFLPALELNLILCSYLHYQNIVK